MATPIDPLKSLPPELRLCVYSHLLSDDGHSTVWISQKLKPENLSSCAKLSAVLASRGIRAYATYRGRLLGAGKLQWPDEVEEAFLQALWCWAEEFGPRSRKFVQNRTHLDIISELIYELTGQKICRKLVSSHIQALKDFFRDSHSPWAELVADIRNQFCQGKVRESETVKTDPASKVRNYRPARPSENTTLSIRNYDSVLSVAIQLKDSLSLHRSTPFAQDLLSLSLVNRLYRTECLHHLASSLHFDFGLDNRAFQRFCSTTPTEFLKVMHLSVSLVEGYMPDLPTLPNLHALAIDLWPRKPTRRNREDRAWGPQTEKLLAALGVEVAAGARISLEMRWAADCERFEREYVGKGRRGRVIGDEGNDAPDPERVFTCRRYEFRGNGWIVVGGTREDEDEEVAFPDVGFVSSG